MRTIRKVLLGALATLATGCFGSSELTHTDSRPLPPAPPDTTGELTCTGEVDPGRVTLHRLNRVEYDNTVRDLLGDTRRPAQDFPADDRGYGYDNNADVLSLAPLLMEKYDAAAQKLVEEAWARDFSQGQSTRIEAESATASTGGAAASGTAWNLWSNGTVSQPVDFVATGDYELSARAWGQQAGSELPRMNFLIDNQVVATFEVAATSSSPAVFRQIVPVSAGKHSFAVEFANDFYDPDSPDPALRDRNLYVDWFELHRPGAWAGANAKVRVCDPAVDGQGPCARTILERFALRAWRRPPTPAEIDRLMGFLQVAELHGEGFDAGVKLALHAVLLSPHFLFRVELDPDPASTTPHPVTDYELAARLSYFLWSSTPDDELLQLASQGVLSSPSTLQAQVDRMLEDPRAEALVDNFAGQWLESRAVFDTTKDPVLFPEFDEELQAAAKAEVDLFFRTFLKEDRKVRDMLDADFTFLNDRLAAHYGLPPVGSDQLQRVTLPADGRRVGLLTQAAFLTITSQPNRTSPVKRGLWVLEHLLCKEPPPPPPNVENLAEPGEPTGTLRERFEQHRSNPSCSGCHALMDPIGFGLENYDAIGRWRTEDVGGFAIDSSGALPGGHAFNGAAELSQIIKADPALSACIAQNMLTYALGRGFSHADACAIEEVATAFDARGGTLEDLVHAVVQSTPFTRRRGEPGGNP